MNDLRDSHDPDFDSPGRDPLDRLVDAFVDLSVPVGPDASIQRSLVARLMGGAIERAPAAATATHLPGATRANRWSFVLQTLATAAVIAVAATAIVTTLRRNPQENPTAPAPQELVAAPASDAETSVASANEDLNNLAAMVSKILHRRTELTKSESWRQAHERLSSALDRPEVIGLGFGLLGTVPWASYARF
jgi:hypothetical protein